MPDQKQIAVAAFAVSIGDSDLPEWIEVLPAGTFAAVDGRGPFENSNPDLIIRASVAKMPEVGLVLDYDHSTDLAAPEGRPSIAAGWIKQFRVEGGAIFARIEWTQRAAEALKAKEYRYISPVFEHSKDGKVERILRAALTNNPALINLPAIASAQRQTMAKKKGMSLSDMAEHFPPKEGESAIAHGNRLMRHLAAEEEASEGMAADTHAEPDGDERPMGPGAAPAEAMAEESEEAMSKRHEEEMAKCSSDEMRAECASRHAAEKEEYAKKKMAKEENCRMSAETKPEVNIAAEIAKHPMVVQMASELNQMRLAQARKTAEHAVDQAIREGRLIPSQRDWAIEYCTSEPKGFATFIGAQPKIIQQGSDGTFTGRIGEPVKGVEVFSAKQREILANLGLESKEQIEKCAAIKEKWDLKFARPSLMLDGEKHE